MSMRTLYDVLRIISLEEQLTNELLALVGVSQED
jgi:hypothetical protein